MAVAFAHEQENEEHIGIGMLRRALEKLGDSPSMYHSIDVDKIRKNSVDIPSEPGLLLFCICFSAILHIYLYYYFIFIFIIYKFWHI